MGGGKTAGHRPSTSGWWAEGPPPTCEVRGRVPAVVPGVLKHWNLKITRPWVAMMSALDPTRGRLEAGWFRVNSVIDESTQTHKTMVCFGGRNSTGIEQNHRYC